MRTPQGDDTRPTLGRVRTSLFSILQPRLAEARVMDGFAGCGALGLEALSRGTAYATLIETAKPALETLRANIQKLGMEQRAQVIARDVLAFLSSPTPPHGEPFDLIFFDPPYGEGLCHRSLRLLGSRTNGWLAPGGWVIAQVGGDDRLDETYGQLTLERTQLYSATRIDFYGGAPERDKDPSVSHTLH